MNNKSSDVNLVDDIKGMVKQLDNRISLKEDTFLALKEEEAKRTNLLKEKEKTSKNIVVIKKFKK